ncbi:hypothetical protein P280DRAFT_470081 [Massarina eburnea CBS 473.64]|uniref:Inheritance of peroxisomes protein 1 n=1 Tax=Massarina eburnea CBS 473.64 TaxID=1395130 RepID=A0A6A6S2E7_9PLEO|nr:hypothetical protein P280DRAFT_470081 [Massarina eburnea CBS 473.64]
MASNHARKRSVTIGASTTVELSRIAHRPRVSPDPANSADGIETLFVCTSTKIVSFTASVPRRASPSRRGRGNGEDDTRSIPWRSPAERTMAVGVLRIYRVTSSNVSFLNSGNLLHTIFPKSQCWRVDGESIFVLRVRQDSYYRMELPYESAEDKEKVEQFRGVLGQVLQFEKTQSPFDCEVQVQPPERPKTPPRKKLSRPPEKAKKWLFDKKWMPNDGSRPNTPVAASDSGTVSSYEEDDRSSVTTDRSELVPESPESPETLLEITPPTKPASRPRILSVAERTRTFQMRSVTAPIETTSVAQGQTPQTSEQPSEQPSETPHKEVSEGGQAPVQEAVPGVADTQARAELDRKQSADAESMTSATESFYSLEPSTRSPSPPYVDTEGDSTNPWEDATSLHELEERGRSSHRRQISEMTLKASSPARAEEEHELPELPQLPNLPDLPKIKTYTDSAPITPTTDIRPSSAPSTPQLVSDSDSASDAGDPSSLDVATPPPAIRMKRLTGASQRRAFSPMPPQHNLFRPVTHSGPGKQFTAALLRKTCEIVFGPPAHLVQLMLRIAANVSDGAFGFNTYRVRRGERLPCTWESSDEENWVEEDDFGIPLRTVESETRRSGFSHDRSFSRDVD